MEKYLHFAKTKAVRRHSSGPYTGRKDTNRLGPQAWSYSKAAVIAQRLSAATICPAWPEADRRHATQGLSGADL